MRFAAFLALGIASTSFAEVRAHGPKSFDPIAPSPTGQRNSYGYGFRGAPGQGLFSGIQRHVVRDAPLTGPSPIIPMLHGADQGPTVSARPWSVFLPIDTAPRTTGHDYRRLGLFLHPHERPYPYPYRHCCPGGAP